MSERGSWQRLLDARRNAVSSFFEEEDAGAADDLDVTLDNAVRDAAQRMDPDAGHSPWLDVRVMGPDVGAGALSVRILDVLVPPIQAEIDAALPDASKESTSLELVGIGSGSAILRFQPKVPLVNAEEGALPMASSVIDAAVRRVFDVHDAIEREDSPERIVSTGTSDLLARLQKLVSVLESNNLTIEFMWRPPTAPRRTSTLTRRGREYARGLFEPRPDERNIAISGYVYEQSLRGSLKLKLDPRNIRSHAYEIAVSPEELQRMDLKLNSFVHALVTERTQTDRLGRQSDASYEFIRLLASEEMLEDGPGTT